MHKTSIYEVWSINSIIDATPPIVDKTSEYDILEYIKQYIRTTTMCDFFAQHNFYYADVRERYQGHFSSSGKQTIKSSILSATLKVKIKPKIVFIAFCIVNSTEVMMHVLDS